MSTEEKYVAAAYLVVFLFVLVYVVIMAAKLARLGRDVGELTALARERKRAEPRTPEQTPPKQVKVG
jgi:CcmD family protein